IFLREQLDLLGLALADEGARLRRRAALERHRDRFRARGLRERAQLVHRALVRVLLGGKARAGQPDQHRALGFAFDLVFGHAVPSSVCRKETKSHRTHVSMALLLLVQIETLLEAINTSAGVYQL